MGRIIHNKQEDMNRERREMFIIKQWLGGLFGFLFEDVSLEEQMEGKDLCANGAFYEVKIRDPKYRTYFKQDLLIETISNSEKDSPGWIYYSKADWLLWIFKPIKDLAGYLISMKELQRWWRFNQFKYEWKTREAYNEGYITINKEVPLKFLKGVKIIFLPEDYGGYKIE